MLNDVFATATATANTMINTEVRIWIDGDEHANRVSAVLEALGYTVLRELDEGDGPARLCRGAARPRAAGPCWL